MNKLKMSTKLGYAAADLGGAFANSIIGTYFMFYCTNVVNIPLVAVGMIIFFSKIWDGINDIIIGGMVDRTFTKQGQARPWIARFTIPFVVTSCIMFAIPSDASVTAKVIWAVIAYSAYTWCFTAINLPYSSLMPLMTSDNTERTVLNTLRIIGSIVGNIVVMAGFLPLVEAVSEKTGDKAMSYLIVVTVYAVLGGGLWYLTYFTCHEKKEYTEEEIKDKKEQMKSGSKDYSMWRHMKYLFTQNLPWLCAFGIALCIYTRQVLDSNSLVYYYIYVLKLPEANSSVFSTVGYLCTVVFMPFVGIILTRLGYKKPMIISNIMVSACLVLGYIFSENIVLAYIFHSLSFGLLIVSSIAILNMLADSIDYGELKYGLRLDGLGMTAYSFSTKVGPAVGSLLCTIIFSIAQLDTSVAVGGTQKPVALLGINITLWLLPAVLHLIVAVLAAIYPLTHEKRDTIIKELEAKRKNEKVEE